MKRAFSICAPKRALRWHRSRPLLSEQLEDRSLLATVGYQIHLLPPDGAVSGPELTTVNVGDSFDVAVTVQDLRSPPGAFAGVFAGYLDIAYDSDKARLRVSELQRISIGPSAATASGTFSLNFGGQTTQPITFAPNAAALASAVQEALAALPAVGAGNVAATVDVLSSDSTFQLQVRFTGKFFDQDVPNLTVASQNFTGSGSTSVSITHDGDLKDGISDFAFREAFRSRTAPAFPNGLSAGNFPNLIDDVGAFAGLQPTGTASRELVRSRWTATASGSITFTPSVSNRSLPAHDTLLYNPIAPVLPEDIDLGGPKILIIDDGLAGPIQATADLVRVIANSSANSIDVLANDSTSGPDPVKTVVAVTQPANGAVTFTAEGILYTPIPDFTGIDSFTYTSRNLAAGETSESSTAVVTVLAVAPIEAVADSVLIQPNSAPHVIDILKNDLTNPATGQVKNVISVTQPSHGAVTFTADQVMYTPAANFQGLDSFTYEARNVTAGNDSLTSTATVTVSVGAPIIAQPDQISIPGNAAPTRIEVLANDTTTPATDTLKFVESVTQPVHGTVEVWPNYFVPGRTNWVIYTPEPGFGGTDTFTYEARNYAAGSNSETSTTTVTVTVTPADSIVARYQVRLVPPDAPLFMPDPNDSHALVPIPDLTQVTVGQSYDLVVTVQNAQPGLGVFAGYLDLGYDSAKTQIQVGEIQRIRLSGSGLGGSGSFKLVFGDETTTPITRSPGEASFVNAIRSALEALPSIGPGNVQVRLVEDTTALYEVRFVEKFFGQDVPNITVGAADQLTVTVTYDGDLQNGLSDFAFKEAFRSRGLPTISTLSTGEIFYEFGLSAGNLPNLIDDVGAFTGRLDDTPGQLTAEESGEGFTAAPPRELVRTRMVAKDSGMAIFAPSFTNISAPNHNTLVFGIDGKITQDRIDPGTSAVLNIVAPSPFAASADIATAVEDSGETTIDVLANDTVVSGQTIRILGIAQPAHGLVTLDASGLVYKPNPDFVGTDTFTYTAINSAATNPTTAATAAVTVVVTDCNDAPSFATGPDQSVTDESGPQSVAQWASAISAGPPAEGDQSLDFVVIASDPSLFSVQPDVDATGRLTFTPQLNATGTAQVTVFLRDSGGTASGGIDASESRTFAIEITKLRPQYNAVLPLDASGDGNIVAGDALDCINYLNALGFIDVEDIPPEITKFLDVDGDGHLAPSDPLAVINYLNAFGPLTTNAGSEGESPDAPADDSLLALLAQDLTEQAVRRKRG